MNLTETIVISLDANADGSWRPFNHEDLKEEDHLTMDQLNRGGWRLVSLVREDSRFTVASFERPLEIWHDLEILATLNTLLKSADISATRLLDLVKVEINAITYAGPYTQASLRQSVEHLRGIIEAGEKP